MPAFYDLITDLLNLSSQDRGTDAEVMVKSAINRAYRRALRSQGMETERREFSLTTVADTSKYGLPLYVQEVYNIEDTASTKRLNTLSALEYDSLYPGTTTTGTPISFYEYGSYGVQKQPAAAGVITFTSDNASDDGVMRLTGFNAAGTLITDTATLNGTTDVDTTESFTTIERPIKQRSTATKHNGNITITDASANTLGIIPYWVDSPTYKWIQFYPIPDAALTYVIRAEMYKPDLVNDYDWPDIPERFHDVILMDAATEVLPVFGKETVAEGYGIKLRGLEKDLGNTHWRQPSRQMVFRDVQADGSFVPYRPLIKNVDIV